MLGQMTALVTGSSKGLGRSIALAFARGGYNLIIHGRNKERLAAVQNEVVLGCGMACDMVIGSITLPETITRLTNLAARRNLDVLVNNAATYIKKAIEQTTADEIRAMININLTAPILLTQAIFPIFTAKQKGTIININSLAAKEAAEGQSIYCATKCGLRGFSKGLQFDATRTGVRVIDVYPGAMKTDMTKERGWSNLFIEPDEVAAAILALCSVSYKTLRIKEIEIGRKNY
ncbi:MAG: SDR family oxidoreductase [Gammaproteobacteria bacterium]|nr:SDR family oxidoreductase [Gammaproteobacteria bacterium]